MFTVFLPTGPKIHLTHFLFRLFYRIGTILQHFYCKAQFLIRQAEIHATILIVILFPFTACPCHTSCTVMPAVAERIMLTSRIFRLLPYRRPAYYSCDTFDRLHQIIIAELNFVSAVVQKCENFRLCFQRPIAIPRAISQSCI